MGKLKSNRQTLTDEELERLTASEFVKLKLSDDEKLRLRAINEKRRLKTESSEREWIRAERPLIEELQAAGINVESAWDLINRKEPWNKKECIRPYPAALPILLEHLERPYPDRVRAGIARALALGRIAWEEVGIDVDLVWDTLARLYQQANDEESWFKDGLAVALSALARSDNKFLVELVGLAEDVHNGESRILLLNALEGSSDPYARASLMKLESDRQLRTEIQAIFRRRR